MKEAARRPRERENEYMCIPNLYVICAHGPTRPKRVVRNIIIYRRRCEN